MYNLCKVLHELFNEPICFTNDTNNLLLFVTRLAILYSDNYIYTGFFRGVEGGISPPPPLKMVLPPPEL